MRLLVRADGDDRLGTGHVMRCLALAQAWQDAGGDGVFVTTMGSPALEARLRSEGMDVIHVTARAGSHEDASQTAQLAKQQGASWVVVDGYHFGAVYQEIVKGEGARLLWIDDEGHARAYCADLVLNQNLHADERLYVNRAPDTQLLLGARYALLRREFLKWGEWKREIRDVARKVLVTFGGADPDNVTLKVIHALQHLALNDLEGVAVIGECNPHAAVLQSAIGNARVPFRLRHQVTDMAELMAWADVAIAAAGSTSWELAFMGLPSVLVTVAANQRPVAERWSAAGAAMTIGREEGLASESLAQGCTGLFGKAERRAAMSRQGQALVDGEGAGRIVMRLREDRLRLRAARERDVQLLWEWVNDPEVRATAFSPKGSIGWNEHVRWYLRVVRDPDTSVFMAVDDQDVPVGQARLEACDRKAEIHVSVDRPRRGSGYGSLLVGLAVDHAFRHTPIETVHALIKPDNERSIRTFEHAGFQRSGVEAVEGCQALRYVRMKSTTRERVSTAEERHASIPR